MLQQSPEWKHNFLSLAGKVVQYPLRTEQEGKEDKHSHGQDSTRKRQASKRIFDDVQPRGCLIPDLQDGVAYVAFLNG